MQPVVLTDHGLPVIDVGLYVPDSTELPMIHSDSVAIYPGQPAEDVDEEALKPLKLKFCGEKLPQDLLFFSPLFLEHLEQLKESGTITRIWQTDEYLMVATKGTLSLHEDCHPSSMSGVG